MLMITILGAACRLTVVLLLLLCLLVGGWKDSWYAIQG
jgi:hypothetical protein